MNSRQRRKARRHGEFLLPHQRSFLREARGGGLFFGGMPVHASTPIRIPIVSAEEYALWARETVR